MPRKDRMTDDKLVSILEMNLRTAVGYVGGEISEERRKAMEYYLGEPFGNEVEGRSQVISTDVQDTIESMMPDFMEIFGGDDAPAQFQPEGLEDERTAEQATDYVNFIWARDNDGFGVTHDWIKDALLQKNGVIKIWWDESTDTKKEVLENVTSADLALLMQDDEVEIVAQETKPVPPEWLPFVPDGILYDLEIKRTREKGRVRIEGLPPEEFLIGRRSVNLEEPGFKCHRFRKTITEMVEMGFDPKDLEDVPSHDEAVYNEERTTRFNATDEWPDESESPDETMRDIWAYECYLHVDYDGDGLAEPRQVFVAGPGYKILPYNGELTHEVEDHPFVSLTPVRMPHKFFGRSVADLVSDVQLIKSTVQRQLLDNMYSINNARTAIQDTKVNLDDLLTLRPAGYVRTHGPPSECIMPMTTQSLGPYAFPLLEYWDSVRETRTGVTRYNQGLDASSLNKTATGISQILGRAQRRMMMIARLFAETGFTVAFRKILKLTIDHQDRPRVVRLRNEWVQIDPRSWNAEMDVIANVSIMSGTREAQATSMRMLLEVQNQIIERQGGIQGPLVTLDNVHAALKKFTSALGEKNTEAYFADPKAMQGQPPPEPPPDPKMIEVKLNDEREKVEIQMRHQREMLEMQLEDARKREELGLKVQEMNAEMALKQAQTQANGQANGQSNGQESAAAISELGQGMAAVAQQMAQVSRMMAEAVTRMTADREIVRDAQGAAVGVRIVGNGAA